MELQLFILICFLASMIHVIGGFGGTMLAMPFTILIFGAQDAVDVLVHTALCGIPISGKGTGGILQPLLEDLIEIGLENIPEDLLPLFGFRQQ